MSKRKRKVPARSTPTGHHQRFLYGAREFQRAGNVLLAELEESGARGITDPIYCLYHHAAELALKAFLEVDLVAHCGSSTEGFYLCTLCVVDIAPAGSNSNPSGAGPAAVGGAIHQVHARLPMPLLGLDSDNGSEFINYGLYAWCQRHAVEFTRGRAWQKNDSAHVEQKNGAIVRGLVGYDRFTSKVAYAQLRRVYALARRHVNSSKPVQKLVRKTRAGARPRRYYDDAQTPYQRLCAAGVLPPATRDALDALYQSLNPLQLRRDLE